MPIFQDPLKGISRILPPTHPGIPPFNLVPLDGQWPFKSFLFTKVSCPLHSMNPQPGHREGKNEENCLPLMKLFRKLDGSEKPWERWERKIPCKSDLFWKKHVCFKKSISSLESLFWPCLCDDPGNSSSPKITRKKTEWEGYIHFSGLVSSTTLKQNPETPTKAPMSLTNHLDSLQAKAPLWGLYDLIVPVNMAG